MSKENIKELILNLELKPSICGKKLFEMLYFTKNSFFIQNVSENLNSFFCVYWKDIESSVKIWKNRMNNIFKGIKSAFKASDLLMMSETNFIDIVIKIPYVSGLKNIKIVSEKIPFIYIGTDKSGFRTLSIISKKSDCFSKKEIEEFAVLMEKEKTVKGFMHFLGKIKKSQREYAIEKNIILNDKYVIDEYLRLV